MLTLRFYSRWLVDPCKCILSLSFYTCVCFFPCYLVPVCVAQVDVLIHVITPASVVCEKHGHVLVVCVVCSHKDKNGTSQSKDYTQYYSSVTWSSRSRRFLSVTYINLTLSGLKTPPPMKPSGVDGSFALCCINYVSYQKTTTTKMCQIHPLAVYWPLYASHTWELMHQANLSAGDRPERPSGVSHKWVCKDGLMLLLVSSIPVFCGSTHAEMLPAELKYLILVLFH